MLDVLYPLIMNKIQKKKKQFVCIFVQLMARFEDMYDIGKFGISQRE